MSEIEKVPGKRFLVIQVISKKQQPEDVATDLQEIKQLVETYRGVVSEEIIQRRDTPHPAFYVGPGKVEELRQIIKDRLDENSTAVDTGKISVVVINDLVKPSQLFRIEKELWKVDPTIKVWDRLDLILNIFDIHATTTESKLQIDLARVSHAGPRIYGLGKTELSRQGGGIGGRGKGETNIEFEQRLIKATQQDIKQKLAKIAKQRHARMESRKDQGIGPVALVGYTSAGKTTLFNALTGKEKEMNKGLFTTLDTVVGKMKSQKLDQPVLISDTIGFIRNLPPVLLDSFKSTLLESLESELILHVVDVSDPEKDLKMQVVLEILAELDIKQPIITVFNKIDSLDSSTIQSILEESKSVRNPDSVYISAQSGEGLEVLKARIEAFFS